MKNGSEAFQVLKTLLKPTLQILIWMTGLRTLLYFACFYQQIHLHPDLIAAFWAGFRFDILVLGFFWIPVVVFTWLTSLLVSPRKLFNFWKLYFNLVILIIFNLSFFDYFWTGAKQARMNNEFFKIPLAEILQQGWIQLGAINSIFGGIWILFSAILVAMSVYSLQLPATVPATSKGKVALQVFGSILLVAFSARGTWTPHHLNIEHAQVSTDPRVNQLPLNSVWNLDK